MIFWLVLLGLAGGRSLALSHFFLHKVELRGHPLDVINTTGPSEPPATTTVGDLIALKVQERETADVVANETDAVPLSTAEPITASSGTVVKRRGRTVESPTEVIDSAGQTTESGLYTNQADDVESAEKSKARRLLRSILEEVEGSEDLKTPKPRCRCPSGEGDCSGEVCRALEPFAASSLATSAQNRSSNDSVSPLTTTTSSSTVTTTTSSLTEDLSHIMKIPPRQLPEVQETPLTELSSNSQDLKTLEGDQNGNGSATNSTTLRDKRAAQEELADLVTMSDEMAAGGETTVSSTTQLLAADAPEGFSTDPLLLERSRRLYRRSDSASTTTKKTSRVARQAQVVSKIESTSTRSAEGSSVSSSTSGNVPTLSPSVNDTMDLPTNLLPSDGSTNDKEIARTRYVRRSRAEEPSGEADELLETTQRENAPIEPSTEGGISDDVETRKDELKIPIRRRRVVVSLPKETPEVKEAVKGAAAVGETESASDNGQGVGKATEQAAVETKIVKSAVGGVEDETKAAASAANHTDSATYATKSTANNTTASAVIADGVGDAANAAESAANAGGVGNKVTEGAANATESRAKVTAPAVIEQGSAAAANGSSSIVIKRSTSATESKTNATASVQGGPDVANTAESAANEGSSVANTGGVGDKTIKKSTNATESTTNVTDSALIVQDGADAAKSTESAANGSSSVANAGGVGDKTFKRATNATESTANVTDSALIVQGGANAAKSIESAANGSSSVANAGGVGDKTIKRATNATESTANFTASEVIVQGAADAAKSTESAANRTSSRANIQTAAGEADNTAVKASRTNSSGVTKVQNASLTDANKVFEDHYGREITHKKFYHPVGGDETTAKSTTSRGERKIKEKQEAAGEQERRRLGEKPETDELEDDLGPLDVRTMGGNQIDDDIDSDDDSKRDPANFKETGPVAANIAERLLIPFGSVTIAAVFGLMFAI